MNLVNYIKEGLELVINQETGEAFASISAVARMIDKDKATVSRYVNGELQSVAQMTLLSAEIKTAIGLRSVALLNENQILEVVCKYKPDLLMKFAQCGLRVFLHQLAGFKVESTAVIPQAPQTYLEALKAMVALVEEKERLEAELLLADATIEQQSEVIDELFDWSSIIRIAKFNNCSEKSFNWRKLKVTTQSLGLEPKRVPCPRFGEKLLYPHEAWNIAYPNFKLPENCLSITKRS